LASLRDKTTLLYFWSSWTKGGKQDIERIYSQIQNDPSWMILGMNVDDTLKELQEHLARYPLDWPVVHLGLKHQSQVFKDYCAIVPSYIIIGPQGRIRAADYFDGDRLHKTVTEFRSQSP
jgi:peroxiredoxin